MSKIKDHLQDLSEQCGNDCGTCDCATELTDEEIALIVDTNVEKLHKAHQKQAHKHRDPSVSVVSAVTFTAEYLAFHAINEGMTFEEFRDLLETCKKKLQEYATVSLVHIASEKTQEAA